MAVGAARCLNRPFCAHFAISIERSSFITLCFSRIPTILKTLKRSLHPVDASKAIRLSICDVSLAIRVPAIFPLEQRRAFKTPWPLQVVVLTNTATDENIEITAHLSDEEERETIVTCFLRKVRSREEPANPACDSGNSCALHR